MLWRCEVSCRPYTVVEAFSVRCLIKYCDYEIQSLIRCRRKKSKTLRNEGNAERRWLAENVDFGAILDGENECIRAYDTATDICSNFERRFLSFHFFGEKMNRSP